ncbi:MAG: LPS export ABC transporter periplasmic protein LptC [Hyphomonadaceae bacterium]
MTAETVRDLDLWAPHRQLSLAQARKRTQIVKWMRLSLVASAIITLGVFLGFVARSAYTSVTGAGEAPVSDEMVVMLNPRFSGRDANGELYIITADSAERRRANNDLVDLVNPKLENSKNGDVIAPLGLFDRSTETLNLFEDVLMRDARGYLFHSTHAKVEIETGKVIGLSPLEGTGPIGDITAGSYELNDSDDSVLLTDGVRTIILPEAPNE